MFQWVKKLVDKYKARKRGETRIAPYGVRGRVFDKVEAPKGPGKQALGKGKLTISAKIIRADGTEEDLGDITNG